MLFGNTIEAEAPACSNPPYTSKSPAAAINPAERLIFNSDFLSEYPRSLILLMISVFFFSKKSKNILKRIFYPFQ